MREIKFRGKRIDDGKWVQGGFHEHVKRTPCPIGDSIQAEDIAYFIIKSGFSDWNMPKPIQGYEVDPETVCQYTGLKDKNGREIYEGDILKDQKGIGYVEWVVEHCAFVAKAIKNGDVISYHLLESDGQLKNTEVIGNRWENPELLGQTND